LEIVDSSATDKGAFSFDIPILYTDYYSIRLKSLRKGFVFICSPGDYIKIKCDTSASNFYFPDITGSMENTLNQNFINGRDPLIAKMNSYADSASRVRKDSVKYNRYVSLNDFWSNEIRQYNLKFMLKNPKCLISLNMYNSYYKLFSKDSVKQYLKNLPLSLRKNPLAKEIEYKKFFLEDELKKITKFYDIKFYDTLNQLFTFESYSNKLVLVDFWASWCKPCIENFPLLKKIEEKYRDKNFAILGVSLDVNLKRWKNEIKRSGLTWGNISDLKGENGLGAKYLNVTTIPRYVLIGRDGSIINDNIKEEEIEKMVISNL
jgi:thiol-disulfide isomerase/thioredoxin